MHHQTSSKTHWTCYNLLLLSLFSVYVGGWGGLRGCWVWLTSHFHHSFFSKETKQSQWGWMGRIHSVQGCPDLIAGCLILFNPPEHFQQQKKKKKTIPVSVLHLMLCRPCIQRRHTVPNVHRLWTLNLRYCHLQTRHEMYKATESASYHPFMLLL